MNGLRDRIGRVRHRGGYPLLVNGHRYLVRYDTRLSFGSAYDMEAVAYIRRHSPLGTVWNIGANVGQWGLQLMHEATALHLFEPNPTAHEALRWNVDHNRAECTVTLHRFAVGASPGLVPFHAAGHNGMSRPAAPNPLLRGQTKEVPVAMTTIDILMRQWGVPDWIVMDIEGYEIDALAGAAGLLSLGRTNWLIELHPGAAWGWCHRSASDLEQIIVANNLALIPVGGQTRASLFRDTGMVALVP